MSCERKESEHFGGEGFVIEWILVVTTDFGSGDRDTFDRNFITASVGGLPGEGRFEGYSSSKVCFVCPGSRRAF